VAQGKSRCGLPRRRRPRSLHSGRAFLAILLGARDGAGAAGLADCKEHRLGAAEVKEIRARVANKTGPRRRAAIYELRSLAPRPRLLPASEADLERLARHEEYLEWRKTLPRAACRAGDGPARFTLRSLC
jgi:hypothetical protein